MKAALLTRPGTVAFAGTAAASGAGWVLMRGGGSDAPAASPTVPRERLTKRGALVSRSASGEDEGGRAGGAGGCSGGRRSGPPEAVRRSQSGDSGQ